MPRSMSFAIRFRKIRSNCVMLHFVECHRLPYHFLLNILFQYSIVLIIKRSTRYGENSSTRIDNFLANVLYGKHLAGIIVEDFFLITCLFFISRAWLTVLIEIMLFMKVSIDKHTVHD